MSRFRERLKPHTIPEGRVITNNQIGVASDKVYLMPSPMHYNYTDSMVDEITPDYFKEMRLGHIVNINPMTQKRMEYLECSKGTFTEWRGVHSPTQTSVVRLEHPIGYQSLWGWANLSSWTGMPSRLASNYGFTTPSVASESELAIEAIARARTSGMDAGTFLKEFNKTISMIVSCRDNVFRRAHSIVEARKSAIAARGIAAFSETWLEARYGWRQIAFDLSDITEAIYKLKSGLRTHSRAYASDKGEVSAHWSASNNVRYGQRSFISSNNRSKILQSMSGTYSIERRAGAIVELMVGDIAFIDPLITGWEVIPFSFIVDWFTNIGSLVKAYSPFTTGQLVGLWTSERVRIRRDFEALAVPYLDNPDYTVLGDKYGVFRHSYKEYRRKPLDEPPFTLHFKLDLDWQKLVDLATITAGKYLRLMGRIRQQTRV